MDWPLFATLTVTAAVAVLGYLAKYASDVRLEQRKSQLARVDRQLNEFYGPLFGLVRTGSWAFAAFLESVRPDGTDFSERAPTDNEAAEYRLWITHVLMPLNRRVAELIFANAALLEEEEMPRELLQATANVFATEALLQQWHQDDHSVLRAVVPFPADELHSYTAGWYVELKRRQRDLLQRLSVR
jgi:hypothetical protein